MRVRLTPLLLLLASAVHAQAPPQFAFPPASLGVPYNFTLPYAAAIVADLQMAQSIGSVMGVSITVGFFITGGSLPPGLSFAPYGVFSGTPTAAGTYNFSITYELKVRGPGVPGIDLSSPAAPGSITVQGSSGPQFSVQPGGLSFSYVAGAAASSQFISVVNQGSPAAPFSATVSTRSGGSWLSAPTASGSAPAFGQGSIAVTADPTGLAPGVYTGYVTISVSQGATQFNVPVLLTITGATQVISLSQTGLSFQAVAGAAAPPPQSFSVLNAGIGSLTWTAAASTLSGGSWLTETPVAGASGSGAPPVVQAHVNPAGLAAGNYYGQVQIASAGVDNSPQSVSVVLSVLASTANPAPLVAPTGLIFVGPAGGANPAAQTVQIANLSSTALPYTSLTSYNQGTNWLTAPASGTVTAAQPLNISVQPKIAGLAAGVYTADLALYFAEPCWYVRKKNAPWFGKAGENSTVWDSASPKFIMGGSDEDKFDHPTQKPIDLMRRPILNHTKRGELVYEPFLGSGTTLAAAELTERVCCGIELDPKYVDVIVTRWQSLTNKKATLDGDGRTFEEISQERKGAA